MKFLVFFLYGCNILFPSSRVRRKQGTQRIVMGSYGRITVGCHYRQQLNVMFSHACHKGVWGSGGIAVRILNLDTRSR